MSYLTFILDPLKSVFSLIYSFIPTVLGVLAALVVGGLVAREAGKLVAVILPDFNTIFHKPLKINKVFFLLGTTFYDPRGQRTL